MKTRVLVVDDSPTVRRVVADILERRGFETLLAEDGRQALELLHAGARVDLALVDFVMPRMNGFQLCRALRDDAALAATPVVLMSAKSDHIREQFVEATGALDAISKPFDPRALVALVEHALERVRSGRGARAPATLAAARPGPGEAEVEAGAAAAGAEAPELAPHTAPRETADGDLVLSGDLAFLPLGALLQMLTMEQKTCVVHLADGERRVLLALRDGLMDAVVAEGAGDEFRLGRFLIELQVATAADIEEAVARCEELRRQGRPARLGDELLRLGRVAEAQLREALARQSSELTYEAVRWASGRFEVRRGAAPGSAPATAGLRLGLPVAHLIMEGVRRVDEWRVLESTLGSFDTVLSRDMLALVALGDDELSRTEHLVLDAIDGRRTVRAIIDACHMSSFDVCKVLCQLLEARLVRRGHRPGGSGGP